MPSKPIKLPPEVAEAFVRDDATARAEEHYSGKLSLTDIKEMFVQMKDYL